MGIFLTTTRSFWQGGWPGHEASDPPFFILLQCVSKHRSCWEMLNKWVLTQVDELICALLQSVCLEQCPLLAGCYFCEETDRPSLVATWHRELTFSPPLVSNVGMRSLEICDAPAFGSRVAVDSEPAFCSCRKSSWGLFQHSGGVAVHQPLA